MLCLKYFFQSENKIYNIDMIINYNRRTWLNPEDNSDSTSSIVCFDGEVTDLDTDKFFPQRYVEISDCRLFGNIKL
jgi:hypothetical protein